MATGAPDGTLLIQVVVTVEGVAIIPGPTLGVGAGGVGRYSGNDTTPQTVLSWTVTADKVGELSEISLASTTLSHTVWRVTIGSVVWLDDAILDAILTMPWYDLKLAGGTVVKVEVHSDDVANTINASVSIVGKEIG
jgi:hypothetical protein